MILMPFSRDYTVVGLIDGCALAGRKELAPVPSVVEVAHHERIKEHTGGPDQDTLPPCNRVAYAGPEEDCED